MLGTSRRRFGYSVLSGRGGWHGRSLLARCLRQLLAAMSHEEITGRQIFCPTGLNTGEAGRRHREEGKVCAVGTLVSKSWRRYWETHGGRGSPVLEIHRHAQTKGPPDAATVRVSAGRLKLPMAAVRSIGSYYADLTQPAEALRVCHGTSCLLAGNEQIALYYVIGNPVYWRRQAARY